ncbi:hypothetical protein H6F88_12425 [Oculatella sp. FACHB-28]|uniref:hypothetical protein n=1 Tax=Cyanophyceae TaxID=3028117 RepID=UPI0016892035|nr:MULTISPECIES: hypothetical protein [Cyanophyceae]MBD2000718.1 hypothetical protein [Leptolyngbya sp. FACHB-541]MBD2056808.1 hypothetical protein [Oculatella sp. FACHB-28]
MVFPGTARSSSFVCLLALSTMAALTLLPVSAQAQSTSSPDEVEQPIDAIEEGVTPESDPSSPDDLEELRPLSQDGSLLSIAGGQRLMTEANDAIASQDYALATRKLQEARQVFNQLSNFYQELAASFSGIDNRIADSQRTQALETAQMRDQATYQLALVHRAQNQPELAVPLLVQIIRSQQPTRELGQRAYRQLFELGFVDSPYPRNSDEPTSATPTPNVNN